MGRVFVNGQEEEPAGQTAGPRHALDRIELKPRTTAKRFAESLKARIDVAAIAFDRPGQAEFSAGMRYVLGIVDAALSDYDVRDPGDYG